MELSKYNQLRNLQGAAIMVDQNHQHLELFSVMVWSIMTQRNQVRLNKLNCSPHSITPLAKERLQEFKVVNPPPSLFSDCLSLDTEVEATSTQDGENQLRWGQVHKGKQSRN